MFCSHLLFTFSQAFHCFEFAEWSPEQSTHLAGLSHWPVGYCLFTHTACLSHFYCNDHTFDIDNIKVVFECRHQLLFY